MADTVQTLKAAVEKAPIVVKKYVNRRLYNTENGRYITLENLGNMGRGGRDFVVYDAKSGEDITRAILTQIIAEEEGKSGQNLLPTTFLRQLIGFYGGSMQGLVPKYLEHAMSAFAAQQEQTRSTLQKTMGSLVAGGNMEEIARQNIAIMERAFSLFTPFYRESETSGAESAKDETAALRAEVERLKKELAEARK